MLEIMGVGSEQEPPGLGGFRRIPWALPWWSRVQNPPAKAGGTGSIPDPGRSHMPLGN